MRLRQFYLECLAQASYLIGDEESGVAVVVDPRRDVDVYVDDAAAHGLRIEHVFLTHFHADFASGHLELRHRCGAQIHIGATAQTDYPFTGAREQDTWTFGAVRIEVLETPGHTPESISLLVFDAAKDTEAPHAVLTGDCLFIGDVGRPDLLAAAGFTQEEMAGQLYDSTREKLLSLPDETLVYPGHGAGSMCGRSLSTETVSTMGLQRRFNQALQPMSREAFVALVCDGQPATPPYFAHDAEFNKRDHALMEDVLAAMPMISLAEAVERQREGAVILDTRESDVFAAGHLPDSINVGLDGRFATWVGTVLPAGIGIVIAAPAGKEWESARRLSRIGFDRILACVDEFEATLDASQLHVHERTSPDALRKAATGERPPVIIDVRQPGEWESSRIKGSVNIPLTRFADRLAELPDDRPLVLHCKSGYRSCVAASLLARAGRTGFTDLRGGLDAWIAVGHPIEGAPAACS